MKKRKKEEVDYDRTVINQSNDEEENFFSKK